MSSNTRRKNSGHRNGREQKKRVMHVGSYEVGKTLGAGSFGKVKLGTNVFSKEQVAIKFCKHHKLTPAQMESNKREIEIMKLLEHPNIVRLIDVIENKQESMTYLVVEYVSGGELFDFIVARGRVKEKDARHYFRQVVSAVEYCHGNLVVHRDLKPENLLVQDNTIKISDFGLSNVMTPGKLMESFCGSPLYAAPEILQAERYIGPPVDVWSMGVILFAVLCGHLPWSGESQAEVSYNSIRGIYDEPDHLTSGARDLIKRMLTPDCKKRITIDEIRLHPWLNESCDGPPQSYLATREPVLEVRDDIVVQVASLGYSNSEELRKKILENEKCQSVSIYHLLLDRVVEQEMSQVRQQLSVNRSPSGKSPSLSVSSDLMPIFEDEASHDAFYSNYGGDQLHDSKISPFGSQEKVPHTLLSQETPPRPILDPNRSMSNKQVAYSAPVPVAPAFNRGRRASVAVDNTTNVYAPNPNPLSSSCPRNVPGSVPSRRHTMQHPTQSTDTDQATLNSRRMSLDSRASSNIRRQLASELDGSASPGMQGASPRVVKGVFQSSTTSAKSPEECAKMVKKVLSSTDLFVKRRSPFLFQCFDEQSGVKFELEVCKIQQLNITGIHLKRAEGDVWLYKSLCTELIDQLVL